MVRKAATGPRAMVCFAPSRVVATAEPSSVITRPPSTSMVAVITQMGMSTRKVARMRSM